MALFVKAMSVSWFAESFLFLHILGTFVRIFLHHMNTLATNFNCLSIIVIPQ